MGMRIAERRVAYPVSQWRRDFDSGLDLSRNELVHPKAEEIVDAIYAATPPKLFSRYPARMESILGLAEYFNVPPDRLVLTPGSDSALRLICTYFNRRTEGEGLVILQDPNYVAWESTANILGLRLDRITADPGNLADQDHRLMRAARESTGALIAVSVPNGPLGGVLSSDYIDELAVVARDRGHILVLDSCYQAFHGPVAEQFARAGGPTIVVQSMSKSHGLAGARISILCGDPALIDELDAGPLEHAVASTSVLATRMAIEYHDMFEEIWREIRLVRGRTMDRLREWGFDPVPSGGNFVSVPLGTEARAANCTTRLIESGYRIKNLSDVPSLTGYVRFAIADEQTNNVFLSVLRDVLPVDSGP